MNLFNSVAKLFYKIAQFIKLSLLLSITQLVGMQDAKAVPLSEVALFYRCYYQITGSRVKANDPLLSSVKNGTTTAINACLQVLNLAKLTNTPNSTLVNSTNPIAKKVLANFHRIHASWFNAKDFPVLSSAGYDLDIKDLYDASAPALYFTRALFKPDVPVKDAITTNNFLTPLRTNNAPTVGPESGHPIDDFVFTNAFNLAPTGELLGMQVAAASVVNFPASGPNKPAGSVNLNMTLGGGFLGTLPYLLLNAGTFPSFGPAYTTDGALKVHRLWGKAVYKDLLCRELPVIRASDATPLVVPNSSVPFRTTSSCTKCHASHDRISGVVRGMKFVFIGNNDPSKVGQKDRGGNFPTFHDVTQPAETSWSAAVDNNYYRRPTNGKIFFRNYKGDLVDEDVTSVANLGTKVADLDDFYLCIAKRYYSYFTGIDIDNGDLYDPDHTHVLNKAEETHRNIVIQLGLKLKTSQSLTELITNILNSDHYKTSDFGIRSGAHVQ